MSPRAYQKMIQENNENNNDDDGGDNYQLQIHSSTQQSITSADGVKFCHEQHGATRVVLGRELSVAEIEHVTQGISDIQQVNDVEIETFVHGALCVSVSVVCGCLWVLLWFCLGIAKSISRLNLKLQFPCFVVASTVQRTMFFQ